MRIGELADAAGVSVRALRYYEEQGLLEAGRTASGQRVYPDPAVDRVTLVQQLYAAGLNSRAVADLLPCVHTGIATPETLARLAIERERVDARVLELVATRDRLDEVIAAATASAVGVACSA